MDTHLRKHQPFIRGARRSGFRLQEHEAPSTWCGAPCTDKDQDYPSAVRAMKVNELEKWLTCAVCREKFLAFNAKNLNKKGAKQ